MERRALTKEEVVDFTVKAIFNFIAELVGVGTYMFVGCLSCVIGKEAVGNTLGTSLAFGLSVMVGIEISGQTSGGHLNPILTIAGMFFRRLSIPMGIVYIFAQFCGGILGFGLAKALTPSKYYHSGLCCTIPHSGVHLAQAIFIEFFASSILVLMVCAQWHPKNTRLESISLRIGFTLFCLIYACAQFTGGSLNPARSFGPAVWNNRWTDHWIYWLSPIAASVIWAPIYYKLFVELAPPMVTNS